MEKNEKNYLQVQITCYNSICKVNIIKEEKINV